MDTNKRCVMIVEVCTKEFKSVLIDVDGLPFALSLVQVCPPLKLYLLKLRSACQQWGMEINRCNQSISQKGKTQKFIPQESPSIDQSKRTLKLFCTHLNNHFTRSGIVSINDNLQKMSLV